VSDETLRSNGWHPVFARRPIMLMLFLTCSP
jgi:hypothetical protein